MLSSDSADGPEAPSDPGQALANAAREQGLELSPELARAVREGDASGAIAAVFEMQATRGWFPPPKMLEQYEANYEGFTRDLMQMAKDQQKHRQDLERLTVEGNNRRADRGQWMAFILALVVIGGAIALFFAHQVAAGLGLIGIDVVGLATVFITGRVEQFRERAAKRQLMNQVDPTARQGAPTDGSADN